MDGNEVKLSIEERERLMADEVPHHLGFTPRPIQRLSTQARPQSMVDIECRHFLRTQSKDFTREIPTLEYILWVEAGKSPAPVPARPDTSYNSNIWRNFRRQYGLNFSAEGRKISEVIATMYPLNIPAPSQLAGNSYEKYLKESKLFQDSNKKSLAIERIRKEIKHFKELKVKSDARNPPLSERGDILPPENFKQYAHRFIPVPSPPPPPPPLDQKTDLFGRRYTPRSQPLLWKLTYRLNHPEYQKLREEIRKQKEAMEMRRKVFHKTPDLKLSPIQESK
ncbi:unnamed protein product [Lymnaea stagnalis]|uniref:Uncharacterized protein n=1 Tax=Lymnaea stagnalis TaxID=6523 RepID=A0AAV2I9E1_LYMST